MEQRRRHPAGLYVLFFSEMWERFGFYCMLAIFVLYMTDPKNGHPFLQEHSSHIYGIYLGFVYFTPFFGGILADQKLGYPLTIVLGALGLAAGYFLLGIDNLTFFFLGLAALVIGNGLFKPNISTMVGKLYPRGDPRIDSAFTIFYMGINIGAFAAPLAAQRLRNEYGFHTAFASAGVGMLVSLAIFLLLQRWVVFADQPPPETSANKAPEVPPTVQRERHIALLIIFVVVAMFWMGFKQNGNTFNLWVRDCTDRVPAPWLLSLLQFIRLDWFLLDQEGKFSTELTQCINPFFVVALSPVVVWFWLRLKARGLEPSTPAKVGLGMVLAAAAFLVLALGGLAGGDVSGVLVSAWYITGAYFLLTLGELCLSPMGLSLVSKLAAPKHRSGWMGGWFVSTAVGGYLSGVIAGFWKTWQHSAFFGLLIGTSLFAALILFLFLRRLRAAMPAEKKEAAPVPPEPEPEGAPKGTSVPAAS